MEIYRWDKIRVFSKVQVEKTKKKTQSKLELKERKVSSL